MNNIKGSDKDTLNKLKMLIPDIEVTGQSGIHNIIVSEINNMNKHSMIMENKSVVTLGIIINWKTCFYE